MPLRPTQPGGRERILLFGGGGSGKSYAACSIARWAQATGSDAQFHVIDSDDGIPRVLAEDCFRNLENIHVHTVFDWPEYQETLNKLRKLLRPQDWLIFDLACKAWETVQSHYTDQVFGEDLGDYFVQLRAQSQALINKAQEIADATKRKKALNKADAAARFDGWKDWGTINRMFNSFNDRLIKGTAPGNLLCCAKAKALGDEDSDDIKDLCGGLRVKPAGQKSTIHDFHTVLYLRKTKSGNRQITTIKDRARPELDAAENKDLVRSYLIPVAGWVLK